MKKTILFVLTSFLPLETLAAYDTYPNILGNGITDIPSFIYGVLGLIVKVGIPVASVFLIWAGFLFLTSQGDPKKLQTARQAFIWACIGFAILTGAWLLATAVQGSLRAVTG